MSDLNSKTTVSTQAIIDFVKSIEGITKFSRRKKLSSRALLESVALIYVYDIFFEMNFLDVELLIPSNGINYAVITNLITIFLALMFCHQSLKNHQ
ncbi:hypothetical protein [Streptococcus sp. E24BD]|uniref:hypothetical protein n=1 Tax=Streptococcus sp. E24BD TaxID=3278715 RepID=UPI00359F1615